MQFDTDSTSQFDRTFVVFRVAAIAGLIISFQVCLAALLLEQNNGRSQSVPHIQLNY